MSHPSAGRRQDYSHESRGQDSAPQPRPGQKPSKSSGGDKKKKSGMLSFLTLKEPSASAWEDYAEQQKAAAQKGGRPSAVGLPGVSLQKLPDYVPPVNSKWDGLTESAKRKAMDRNKRVSANSMGTQQSTLSDQSLSSESSGKPSMRRYGSYASSKASPSQSGTTLSSTRPSYVPSAPRNPQASPQRAYLPDVAPWDEPPGQYAEPGSLPTHRRSYSAATPVYSPVPRTRDNVDLPRLSGHESPSNFLTSPEASPQTPPTHGPILDAAVRNSSYTPTASHHVHAISHDGSFWMSEDDDPSSKRNNSRTRRLPVNFSRPDLTKADSRPLAFVHDDYMAPKAHSSSDEPFVFFEAPRRATNTTYRLPTLSPIQSIAESETSRRSKHKSQRDSKSTTHDINDTTTKRRLSTVPVPPQTKSNSKRLSLRLGGKK